MNYLKIAIYATMFIGGSVCCAYNMHKLTINSAAYRRRKAERAS